MDYVEEHTYLGTELKYLLEIEAEGFSMMANNFEVEVTCGSKKLHFNRSDLVLDSSGKWYVCFNTSQLGAGKLFAKVTAYVPDDAFEDGIRTEVERVELIPVRG